MTTRTVSAITVVVLMTLAATIVARQSPDLTRFEVVVVKPAAVTSVAASVVSPDRFYRADITLRDLINYAYDLRVFRIVGGPEWLSSSRWEVSAKAERKVQPAEMRRLVQRLLAERFALKTHLETRELPIYELVIARDDRRLGPNIKPAQFDCEPFLSGRRPMLESPLDPVTKFPLCRSQFGMSSGGFTIKLHGHPIARLAPLLETEVQRAVTDKTGLEGSYDIELTYQSELMAGLVGATPLEAQALATALGEQLGLRLRSGRGPVQVIVVDSAEPPAPN